MDNLRLSRLEKTRAVLRNERFQSMTAEAKKKILNELLEKGLLLSDLKMLLLEEQQGELDIGKEKSYLEILPYDVFVSVVTEGNISGSDLIRLCDSSRTLRNYCNRSKVINEEEQSEFLFRKLLVKMGKKIREGLGPKESYKYYTMYIPMMYNRVADKLWKISLFHATFSNSARHVSYYKHSLQSIYPKNIFELLYGEPYSSIIFYYDPQRAHNALLWHARSSLNEKLSYYKRHMIPASAFKSDPEYIFLRDNFLDTARQAFPTDIQLLLEKAKSNIKIKLDRMSRLPEKVITTVRTAENVHDNITGNPQVQEFIQVHAPSQFKAFSDFMTRVRNLQEPASTGQRRATLDATTTDLARVMADAIVKSGAIYNFTDEELYFLIELHQRVLDGELQLEDPFSLQSIMRTQHK